MPKYSRSNIKKRRFLKLEVFRKRRVIILLKNSSLEKNEVSDFEEILNLIYLSKILQNINIHFAHYKKKIPIITKKQNILSEP